MSKAEASHLAGQGGIQQVAGHAVDEWKQVVEAINIDDALCTHQTSIRSQSKPPHALQQQSFVTACQLEQTDMFHRQEQTIGVCMTYGGFGDGGVTSKASIYLCGPADSSTRGVCTGNSSDNQCLSPFAFVRLAFGRL